MAGWLPALFVLGGGGLGGIVNAIMTDNGFIVPEFEKIQNNERIWRPGILGNLFVGAVAALVSWALYGPAAGLSVGNFNADLTWARFAAAVLVAIGGACWLSAEVDKSLLKGAAAVAARKKQMTNSPLTSPSWRRQRPCGQPWTPRETCGGKQKLVG